MARVTTQLIDSDAHVVDVPADTPTPSAPLRLSSPLSVALAILAGVVGAVAFLLISGYLALQAQGLQWGVAIDLNNSVIGIGGAQAPWIRMIALGVVVAAAVVLFSPRREQLRVEPLRLLSANAHSYAFVATLAGIVISAMTLTERPYRGGVLGMNGLTPEFLPPVPQEVLVPFTWIQMSALEATTFSVVAVLLALHVRALIQRRASQRTEPTPLQD
jgi:hypothetical protein